MESQQNEYVPLCQQLDWTTSVRFSPDGQIVRCLYNGTIKLWDVQKGNVSTLPGHQRMLLFMSFSPDGQILISGGLDNQVKWWNVQTGQVFVRNLTTVGFGVDCSPDGQAVASCSADQTIRL